MTSHPNPDERRVIAAMLHCKISVAQIGVQPGRHRSPYILRSGAMSRTICTASGELLTPDTTIHASQGDFDCWLDEKTAGQTDDSNRLFFRNALSMIANGADNPALFVRNADWQPVFDMDRAMAEEAGQRPLDRAAVDRRQVTGYQSPFPACRSMRRKQQASPMSLHPGFPSRLTAQTPARTKCAG